MYFNDEVDWPEVFRECISRSSLADPRRSTYATTMVFLEGGLREIDDQLCGHSPRSRDELAGARLTRDIVVHRAAEVATELPFTVHVGEGAFPSEGHWFTNPDSNIELYSRLERFLAPYLGGRSWTTC